MLNKYSQTPRKRPPKKQRFRGCSWEVVAYKNWTTGALFWVDVPKDIFFEGEYIACSFQVTIIKFCYNYKLFVFSEKQSIYATTRSDSAAAVTSERWSFTTGDFNCRKIEWENFGVLDRWSLIRGDDYTRRLDCIEAYNYCTETKRINL